MALTILVQITAAPGLQQAHRRAPHLAAYAAANESAAGSLVLNNASKAA